MKILCLSDTHGAHGQLPDLPDCDVLVHAGDCTAHGLESDWLDALSWLSAQPARERLLIPGNHDWWPEQEPAKAREQAEAYGIQLLIDQGLERDGVRFWGSPITPNFMNWAFMRETDEIGSHWARIPHQTDVLITHGPSCGVLDCVHRDNAPDEHVGCPQLRDRIAEIRPRVHLFGHIHEGRGVVVQDGIHYINAANMNRHYRLVHKPIMLTMDAESVSFEPIATD